MDKKETIKNIESIINSPIELTEKVKTLLDIQDFINKSIVTLLEDEKIDQAFKKYLEKYRTDENDDDYTLDIKHEIDRDYQGLFVDMLNNINIDSYGLFEGNTPNKIKDEYKETFDNGGYENDVFYVRPYNWDGISYNDCTCGLDDKLDILDLSRYTHGFHSKECVAWETNFYYKPTNLKITWYKYALRDAYSNQILEKDVLEAILRDCIESVNSTKQ